MASILFSDSLLAALSYGLPVLASDSPANLEEGLSAELYLPQGNIEVLADRIRQQSIEGLTTVTSAKVPERE
jgi:hypothetical protein